MLHCFSLQSRLGLSIFRGPFGGLDDLQPLGSSGQAMVGIWDFDVEYISIVSERTQILFRQK